MIQTISILIWQHKLEDIDHTVTILHRYMFVSCCYPVHLTTEPVYKNEFRILQAKPVMCLLVSLVVCKQNIGEEHPTMQW